MRDPDPVIYLDYGEVKSGEQPDVPDQAYEIPLGKAEIMQAGRDLTIVAVQVNVPGPPILDFTIGNVTTGGTKGFQKVIVHVANNGNVLSKPTGTVTIFNAGGGLVETLPFRMDTFLPQTAVDYPILLKKALPAGNYQAAVRLRVPGVATVPGKLVTSSPTFTVSDAELKLAMQLIDQISEDTYDPTMFEDEEKKRILAAIDEKIAGKEVVAMEPVEPQPGGQVIDRMEALRASLGTRGAAKGKATAKAAPEPAPAEAPKERKGVKRAPKVAEEAVAAPARVRAKK